jgi:xanthine dehydrogenase small subunit
MDTPYRLECIINDLAVNTQANPNMVLLDFLRRQEHLTGTKEGCREGDCGACTVLLGELKGGRIFYTTVNSCLLPLAAVSGKHVVTIEGINQPAGLNPVQQALVDEVGTQCGFCTPGFIISLTSCCIDFAEASAAKKQSGTPPGAAFEARAANTVDGNICRCTGHTPIKKAIRRIASTLANDLGSSSAPLTELVERKILPEYFLTIAQRLNEMASGNETSARAQGNAAGPASIIVSGGTDLYVQRAFTMHAQKATHLSAWHPEDGITETADALIVPGTTTVEEFRLSALIGAHFPDLETQLLLFGSSPIRHRATIAGNIVNASPIGDMTCILTALDASVTLQDAAGRPRTIPLRKLYKGYKQLDKTAAELIRHLAIPTSGTKRVLSYEKISRRQYLDIASVNSAMAYEPAGDRMMNVGISAGGVGPTMLYLARTSAALSGRPVTPAVLAEAVNEAGGEISPISDARGSAEYKRLLLRQLIAAHVMKSFPDAVKKEAFV